MTVREIQDAFLKLSPEEQGELGAWFAERQAEAWDRQIEDDAKAGRLDHLIEEALADHAAGRSKPR
ncbi:MAG: hypothetical protein AAGI68_12455 [Planctomycetota bacterium]